MDPFAVAAIEAGLQDRQPKAAFLIDRRFGCPAFELRDAAAAHEFVKRHWRSGKIGSGDVILSRWRCALVTFRASSKRYKLTPRCGKQMASVFAILRP